MKNFRLFIGISGFKMLLAFLGLLSVLYLLTYNSANILKFCPLISTVWSQRSSDQNVSSAYYLLQWQSNSTLKHSSTNSTFKYNGTATQRPCCREHSSTTYYLRHFRSRFIVDPTSHQLTLDQRNLPDLSFSKVRTDSRASAVNKKLIVWYNMPEWMKRRSDAEVFGHCPVSTCNLSTNYDVDRAAADAVVFHGAPSHKPVPPRAFPDQVYVYFMLEPPPIAGSAYRNTPWNSAFNWTWGYRHDADIRTTYFYLEHSKQLPNISFLKDLVRKKEKAAAWFVSNCYQDQAQRLRYVERLKEVLPVDVYGRCGTLHCTHWAKECDTMLTKYFFYLSFENSFCQDYVTEKFSRAFLKDVYVVPVARGGLNYSHHFPEGIFINADDFSSPEELGLYLKKLMNDEDAYIDMLWRIAHFVNLDSEKSRYYYSWCHLCDKLHRLQDNAKTYPDVYGWYTNGTCRPPRKF